MFESNSKCLKSRLPQSACCNRKMSSLASDDAASPKQQQQQQEHYEQTRQCCHYSSFVCCNRRNFFVIGLILFIIAGSDLVEGALRNVNLIIEPPAVRRGQHAILRCLYNLDGAPLYSAKFYRGQLEFYRYTPGEFPNTKVFPFPGIHVDVTSSNATQVLIRNVGFGLSGNFSCEVTADAPLFSTATAVGAMQVVELPEKRPILFTEQTRYEPGEILRANCSTPPSRPRAELKFTINNMVVTNAEAQYIRTVDNLIASRISLKLPLQVIHFASANPSMLHGGGGGGGGYGVSYGGQMMNSVHGPGGGGGLLLRCTAQIDELYQEYKEIELGTQPKDPIPARVTHSSGSGMQNFFSSYFSSSARALVPPPTQSYLLLMLLAATAAGTTAIATTTAAAAVAGAAAAVAELCMKLCCAVFNQLVTYKLHSTDVQANLRLLSQR